MSRDDDDFLSQEDGKIACSCKSQCVDTKEIKTPAVGMCFACNCIQIIMSRDHWDSKTSVLL